MDIWDIADELQEMETKLKNLADLYATIQNSAEEGHVGFMPGCLVVPTDCLYEIHETLRERVDDLFELSREYKNGNI